MTEEAIVKIIVAIISAVAVIVAAVITAVASVKTAKMRRSKFNEEMSNEPLDIPEVPRVNITPFDLPLENQEFGSEEYIEAMGTRFLESRNPNDIHIRKIKRK